MLERLKFLCLVVGAFCLGIVVFLKIDHWQKNRIFSKTTNLAQLVDPLQWLSEELSLSTDQIKTIRSLHQNHQDFLSKKLSEIETAENNIQTLTGQGTFDPAVLKSTVEKAESLRAELRLAVWNHISQTKAALQPTQQEKYHALVAQRLVTPRP
jgi:hypothetical protein